MIDGYMAVWLERQSDGFVQIAAVAYDHNIAHLRDYGWGFPRFTMEREASGDVEFHPIVPDIHSVENDGHPQGE